MTCPICKAPSAGTKPCPGYCEGLAEGREETWRALLERDIAEVERALPGLRDNARRHLRDGAYAAAAIGAAWLVASYVVDCEAWLVRARAALGGSR